MKIIYEPESGRVRPGNAAEGSISFSSDGFEGGTSFTFAPPLGKDADDQGSNYIYSGEQPSQWVQEKYHIIACPSHKGEYIRLNRSDALELAAWLIRQAMTMHDMVEED